MADPNRSRIIPDGWIFKPKVRRGSDASHYFCPATGQIFSTYKALMHYVEYAKKAKVSIYAPDFDAGESSGKRRGRPRTKTKVCEPATRGEVPSEGTKAASAALEQLPSDDGQITVLKSAISGKVSSKSWEESDSKEVFPAIGQVKGPCQRKEAGSAALKQLPSDVGQNKVLKFRIGGEFLKEVSPAMGQNKFPRQRTPAGSAGLKQLRSDVTLNLSGVGQNKVLKFGIGGELPKEASPAVGQTKVAHQRKEASPAALKQRPSDVGQNKVLKSETGEEFPKEVSPAVGQTNVPCQRTQDGSAALKLLPSDVGQKKVLKFKIGGAFPPKGSKDTCLADVKEVFPAVHQTRVTRKRTQAGSAAVKQLPSAAGQNKVQFGISENIPCKRWKEACPLDAKEISPGINHAKIPMVATRAEPERREESCLPDLKELSPGDDHSRDLKSALGVEYPPKKLREGYLHISPAVDQTSIRSTPMREKIPPRRKNYCPPAIEQLSLGQSSKLGGAIDEGMVNIGPMGMTPMGDFGGVQQYTPLKGGSRETNYDWAFEANIFPFHAGSESGEELTISALDSAFQYYMEPSRPRIEHQYRRRNERNKSTRPTVGQLRKKGT